MLLAVAKFMTLIYNNLIKNRLWNMYNFVNLAL